MNKTLSTIVVLASIFVLNGCTNLPDGGKALGRPGSPMFNITTTGEQKAEYVKAVCKQYGFEKGTSSWAECIQRESKRLGYVPAF